MNQRTKNILLALGSVFLAYVLWYFSTIVAYLVIAFVVSLIGKPIVRFISKAKYKKFSISKTMAAFIALMSIWIVFIGFFRFIIPLLVKEFQVLSTIDIQSVINAIDQPVRELLAITSDSPIEVQNKTIQELAKEQLGQFFDFSQVSSFLGTLFGAVGEIFIGFFAVSFISFFFLKDEQMFKRILLALVPSGSEMRVSRIFESIHGLLRRYFVGLLAELVMVGTLVMLGLSIVGIGFNHAVVIGLVAGLFNVIPYIGPFMGAAFGLIIGVALNLENNFVEQTLPLLGYMSIVFGTVQLLDNILFQPLIYSSSVKAHPMEIFIVILVAGSLAGIPGMILAIPTYTILRVVAKEFFDNLKFVRGLTKDMD
ncbi:AI-2E family transporter [Prolixibacteraceae bacterium JC049]|nr:AI-2E family transporter [Prolixibacteraceae bacterium JC049]